MESMYLGGNVSTELAGKEISNNICTLLIHFIDTRATVDLSDLVLLVVILDNRHGGFLVNAFGGISDYLDGHRVREELLTESFLDTLLVVILSATGLTSLQKSLQHDFLGRGIKQDQGGQANLSEVSKTTIEHVRGRTYILIKLESLVHLTREPVYEETTLFIGPTFARSTLLEGSFHRILQELDGDLHRDDLTILDILSDHSTILGPFPVLFGAEKITS